MSNLTPPTEEQAAEANRLADQLVNLAHTASKPAIALTALVAAALKLAAEQQLLECVAELGQQMTEVAQQHLAANPVLASHRNPQSPTH